MERVISIGSEIVFCRISSFQNILCPLLQHRFPLYHAKLLNPPARILVPLSLPKCVPIKSVRQTPLLATPSSLPCASAVHLVQQSLRNGPFDFRNEHYLIGKW